MFYLSAAPKTKTPEFIAQVLVHYDKTTTKYELCTFVKLCGFQAIAKKVGESEIEPGWLYKVNSISR